MVLASLDNPAILLSITALLGLIIGSFLNVVIQRLPRMLHHQWEQQCHILLASGPLSSTTPPTYNLALPASHCPHCAHTLRLVDNIPLLSYLWLKGKCPHCGAPISLRYFLVELGCAILSVAVVWQFGLSLQAAAALILTWSLLCLTVIDIEQQLLPDNITLPLLWLGLLASLLPLTVAPVDAILGASLGYLSLWFIYWLFKLIRKKEAMGHGDFKLLAMLGAWLGWQALIPILLLSSLLGVLIGGTFLLLHRQSSQTPIAFGPYLAFSGWLMLMFNLHHFFFLL